MRARIAGLLAVTLAVLTACGGDSKRAEAADASDGANAAAEANATVVRIVDGDTLVARIAGDDERVRLIGINTPESVDPRRPVECYGLEASNHAKQLLPEGTAIRIERDAEARDRYDRLLGYVYRASDGLFVNLAMVDDGFAQVMTYPPNVTHTDRFVAAQASARDRGIGLWSNCPTE